MTAAAVTCGQTLARTLRDAGVTHMFGLPGGEIRRAPVRRNPEVRSRASASRSNAVSFWTRRRSFRTSCRRLRLREVLHIQTNQRPSAPRPASHAPLSEGCRGPWRRSCLRCVGRGAEGGGRSAVAGVPCSVWKRSSAASSPRSTLRGRSGASPSRRDDNSRGKVQNVRGDSSAASIRAAVQEAATHRCLAATDGNCAVPLLYLAGVSVLADVGGQLAVYREDLRVASTCE